MNRRHFSLVLAALGPFGWEPDLAGDKEHIAWVGHVLARMETIRPGATRKSLLTVFKPQEGGLSSALYSVFECRDCPYFKVVVNFSAVGRSVPTSLERDEDIVVTISKPYLEAGSPAD